MDSDNDYVSGLKKDEKESFQDGKLIQGRLSSRFSDRERQKVISERIESSAF